MAAAGPKRRSAALLVLLLLGMAVRLPGIGDPPLDFHPSRQYHSARLARAYDLRLSGTTGAERAVAEAAKPGELEPPVLEIAAVAGYRLLGGERLWLPRLLAALTWVLGAVLVHRLGRRLADEGAGLVAAGAYLLLPFGVVASRAFQPDPAMTVAIVGATLALLVDHDRRDRRSAVVAAASCAAAVFFKLVAAAFVVPVVLALAWSQGGRRGLSSRRTAALVAAALGPAAAYQAYGLTVGGFLADQDGGRVLPHLLSTAFFWQGWYEAIDVVAGVPLAAALCAGVTLTRGAARAAVAALWVGYASLGLVFTYHYATHTYYHLPLVPLVALGLGVGWARCADRLCLRPVTGLVRAALVLGLIAVTVWIAPAPRVSPAGLDRHVADSAAIGEVVGHSARAAVLARLDGSPLRFHGRLAGPSWPAAADLHKVALEGAVAVPAEERLEALDVDWFVVASLDELDAQPELRALLEDRYPVAARGERWVVYDLR